jgi:hypothetical protein
MHLLYFQHICIKRVNTWISYKSKKKSHKTLKFQENENIPSNLTFFTVLLHSVMDIAEDYETDDQGSIGQAGAQPTK